MDIREIKELSASELEKAIKEQKEALFNLRFQHSINQLENPMRLKAVKKEIAVIKTIMTEKKTENGAEA